MVVDGWFVGGVVGGWGGWVLGGGAGWGAGWKLLRHRTQVKNEDTTPQAKTSQTPPPPPNPPPPPT
eukprot:COSAG06_NODE_57892_length_282_cov_0.427778_1_plen_65_part_10